VRLEVQDPDGETATYEHAVKLHWSSIYLETLRQKNIIRPDKTGDFSPDATVTREEAVTMIAKAAGLKTSQIKSSDNPFADVSTQNTNWRYIVAAFQNGIISPNNLFRSNNSVTRAELLTMVLRALKISTDYTVSATYADVKREAWFYHYIATAENEGLLDDFTEKYFYPAKAITLGETASLVEWLVE
jgi:hypothetical protein